MGRGTNKRLAREIETRQGRLRELARLSNALSQPESEARQAELIEAVSDAKALLTAEQKQALQLYYTQGMSLREAAKRSNCSVDAFEGRLYRALEQLRQLKSPGSSDKRVDLGPDRPSRKKIPSVRP